MRALSSWLRSSDSPVTGKNRAGKESMHENCLISLLPVKGVRRECETAMRSSLAREIAILLRKRDYYLYNVQIL